MSNNNNDDQKVDLFESQDELPAGIRAIINHHMTQIEEGECDSYAVCRDFKIEMANEGYTFDYGLDGVPFDLRHSVPIFVPVHKEGSDGDSAYDICQVQGENTRTLFRSVPEDLVRPQIAAHAASIGAKKYKIQCQHGTIERRCV
jgi:hypothetical protein